MNPAPEPEPAPYVPWQAAIQDPDHGGMLDHCLLWILRTHTQRNAGKIFLSFS